MTIRITLPLTSILCAVLAFAPGCGGGQTGDQSGKNINGGAAEGSPCEDHVSDVALDDASALGFSADDVLDFAARRFDSPLTWQSLDGVQYTPGAGQSTLSLTLSPSGSAALVRSAPRMATGGSGPGLSPLCPSDRLRIAVQAELTTEEGALLESFDSTVEASDAVSASLSQVFALAQLHGNFKVDAVASSVLPGTGAAVQVSELRFVSSLSAAGIAGDLKAQATSAGTNVAGATDLTFAHF